MPINLKTNEINYKDPSTGDYVGINAVAERSTADYVNAIHAEGTTQYNSLETKGADERTAIENKGAATIASIPSDYTSLSGEVDDLKNAINNIAQFSIGKNIADPNNFETGYLESNGNIDASMTRYVTTGFVDISAETNYVVSAFTSALNRITTRYVLLFYDSSKTPIANSYSNVNVVTELTAESPNNAKYMRACAGTDPVYIQVETGTSATIFEAYTNTVVIIADIPELDEIESDVLENTNHISKLENDIKYEKSDNICDPDNFVVGYLNSNGTVTNNDQVEAEYKTSGFIEVDAQTQYTMSIWSSIDTLYSNTRAILCFYDINNTFISGSYVNQNSVSNVQVTSPANAKYIKVCSRNFMIMVNAGNLPNKYENYFFEKYTKLKVCDSSLPYKNVLFGKKWVVCGDSFTNDGGTGSVIEDGKYAGRSYTYPWIIGTRQNMEIVRFFEGGRTLAFPANPGTFTNSLTNPNADWYYQNIPEDADYITIYLGINDEHHATGGGDGEDPTGLIPLGTIDDETTATYYGAWNVVLTWLITNRPNAHIGIIVTNGLSIEGYRTAQIAIARKYGIPFIDLNGDDRTPAMLRTVNPNISSTIKQTLIAKWAVDPTGAGGTVNTHPNDAAQLFESTFIENFLRSI